MSESTSESGLGLEMEKALKAPFKTDEYEWRGQSDHDGRALVLCYVQARAIMDRLDGVCGAFGWEVSYESGPDGGVLCALGIKNPDTGLWIWKEDGAPNTDIEAVKGGISSALKRAGSAWGIGRLLYNLDAGWVTLSPTKGSHRYYNKKTGTKGKYFPPKLPDWAVAGKNPEPPKAEAKPPFNVEGLKHPDAQQILQANGYNPERAINDFSNTRTLTAADEAAITAECEAIKNG